MKIEVVPAQLNRWNVSLARKSNLKLIHNWKKFEFRFVSIPLLRFSLLDSGNGVVHVHAKIESASTSSKTNLESSSTLHFVESLNKKMLGCLFLPCFVQLQKSPFNFFCSVRFLSLDLIRIILWFWTKAFESLCCLNLLLSVITWFGFQWIAWAAWPSGLRRP